MGLGASCWHAGGKLADGCHDQADVAFLLRYVGQGSMQEDRSIGSTAMTP
jgi:hypothetical protein